MSNPDPSARAQTRMSAPAASQTESPRIMVVEDERIVALDLAATLGELGYSIAGMATRGEEAIEQARLLNPNLILMDVRLGGQIDGIQAAQTIRAQRDVPVIYLTAHSDTETLRRAAHSAASGYLVKPFKAPELRCAIEIALHKHSVDVRLREINAELEQRVRQRTAALEAANRELEAFSYSVAHDLRAPLRGINGFSELLMDRYAAQLDPAALGYLTRVRNAATRMSQLIDALLSLARIGNTELQPLECDLTDLLHSLISEMSNSHPDRKVIVSVQPGMRAYADPRLLRSALCNLLDNAWKFTRDRDEAHVEIGQCSGPDMPTFYVRDNGAGFDPVYAEKLFGAFQRLHTEREFPGTGIGLAVVHRVITRHGGKVWAEAKPDQGATFYFSLPGATR